MKHLKLVYGTVAVRVCLDINDDACVLTHCIHEAFAHAHAANCGMHASCQICTVNLLRFSDEPNAFKDGPGLRALVLAACCFLAYAASCLPGMQGFRLTGLLTGLLPLVAFCILKTIICHILRLERGCASVFLSCTTQ